MRAPSGEVSGAVSDVTELLHAMGGGDPHAAPSAGSETAAPGVASIILSRRTWVPQSSRPSRRER